MTDASGVVVWSADYKPFGEVTVNPSSTITNNLRFPGQYYDSETGLHYNYYRDYSPAIGRYIESDPLGIEKGKNHIYVYTENAPTIKFDSQGLGSWFTSILVCDLPAAQSDSSCCSSGVRMITTCQEWLCVYYDPYAKGKSACKGLAFPLGTKVFKGNCTSSGVSV